MADEKSLMKPAPSDDDEHSQDEDLAVELLLANSAKKGSYERTKQIETNFILDITHPHLLSVVFLHLQLAPNPPNYLQRVPEVADKYQEIRRNAEITKEITGRNPVCLQAIDCFGCRRKAANFLATKALRFFCCQCAQMELSNGCGTLLEINYCLFPSHITKGGTPPKPGPRYNPRGVLIDEDDDDDDEASRPPFQYVPMDEEEFQELIWKLTFRDVADSKREKVYMQQLLKRMGIPEREIKKGLLPLRKQMESVVRQNHYQESFLLWLFNPYGKKKCVVCLLKNAAWAVYPCGHLLCGTCIYTQAGRKFCPADPKKKCIMFNLDGSDNVDAQ